VTYPPESSACADRRRRGGVPLYFAIAAIAAALNVSTRTVRRWIASGDLIVHRFNGTIRVAEADLRAFLATHRIG
jgi:excisionase family DNA binding protein